MPRKAQTTPLTLAIGFVLLAGLPLAALGWLGWRLLDQDEALERQRARERLDNAAALATRDLERGLSAWDALLDAAPDTLVDRVPTGMALLAFDERGLGWRAGSPLPFHPRQAPDGGLPAELFADAEAMEFRGGRLDEAARSYRRLASTSDLHHRAAALMRLARVLRKQRQPARAIEAYDSLAALGSTAVAGSPAALVAARERLALRRALGHVEDANRERAALAEALWRGRHPIDRPTFEFFRESLPSEPPNETARRALALSEAAEAAWPTWQRDASGRRAVASGGVSFTTVWRRRGTELRALVTPTADLLAALHIPVADLDVSVRLEDGAGEDAVTAALADSHRITKGPHETGLPWAVTVASSNPQTAAELSVPRRQLLVAGFVLLALVVTGASYIVFRAVSRELRVARLQSDFVSAVSHEFRTPLTAMRHLTELLEEGGTSADRLPHYYEALGRETRRLHAMVENLLDFGRMESGRQTYEKAPVGAVRFMKEVVGEFRAREHTASARVALTIEDGVGDAELDIDRSAIALAVTNLLDNALKYSPPGSAVDVSLGSAAGRVTIVVVDEGPGIPDAEQREIFRKFVRGSAARASNVKGTGIGLAMVQDIVHAHGGHVDLAREAGRGSRFTIVLPGAGVSPNVKGTVPVARGLSL
jgi:two-component system, OmpR family, phosphate regulon sensor histidine kinase PhoR